MLLTQNGLLNLNKELDSLKNKLPKAIERLTRAREQGDLSENSEYAAAKEELDNLNSRILELERNIQQAQVVSGNNGGTIDIGSLVTVEVDGIKREFTLVGSLESDPINGKISIESPVGKALLGKKIGDQVKLNGDVEATYKIVTIR